MADRWRQDERSDRRKSDSVNTPTGTEFETVKMYYEELSKRLLDSESTSALSSEFRNLLQRYESSYKYQEKLTLKLKEIKYQLKSKGDQLASLKEDLKDRESTSQNRLKELKKFNLVINEVMAEKDELQKEILTLREIIQTSSSLDLQKIILKQKTEIECQQIKYGKQVENLNKEIAIKEADKLVAEDNMRKEMKISKKLTEQIVELKTNVWKETQRFTRSNRENLELKHQLLLMKEEKAALSLESQMKHDTINNLQQEKKSLQEKLQDYETKNADLSTLLTTTERKAEEAERKLKKISTENANLLENLRQNVCKFDILSEKYSIVLKDKLDLTSSLSKFEIKLLQSEDILKHQVMENRVLEKQMSGVRNQLASRNNDFINLQKFKTSSDEKLFNKIKHCENLEGSLMLANNRLHISSEKLHQLTRELTQNKSELGKTKFQSKLFTSQIKNLNEELNLLKSGNILLEKKIASFKCSENELKMKIDQFTRQTRELYQDIAKLKARCNFAEKQSDKEKNRNTEMSIHLDRLKEKYKQELQESALVKAQNKKLQDTNYSLQEANGKLTQELDRTNYELRNRLQIIELLTKRMVVANEDLNQYHIRSEAQERVILKLEGTLELKFHQCQLLLEKVALMEVIQKREEEDNVKWVRDIRLMKIEIQNNNRYTACLKQRISQFHKLKQELIAVTRQLTTEKLRAKALEHNLLHRTNLHIWRQIGAGNPGQFNLFRRNEILQKRVVKQNRLLQELSESGKEKDSLIQKLQERRKQPSVEMEQLRMDHKLATTKLRDKLQSLRAEINMCCSTIHKHESEIANLKQELNAYKSQEYLKSLKSRKSN